MRIPTITDEMAVKVFECAASPVAVGVTAIDDESALARKKLQIVADDFDDRIIFLSLIAEEHPAFVDALGVTAFPTLLIFAGNQEVDRLEGPRTCDEMRDALDRAWNRGRA